MGESTSSVKRISAAERQAAALQLRKQGHGFEVIAKTLGYAGLGKSLQAD